MLPEDIEISVVLFCGVGGGSSVVTALKVFEES